MNAPAALRFEDVVRLHSTAAGDVRALGPVSFEIRPGEFVAVMGASGSGKSTLLSLAGALDRPTQGWVSFNGRNLQSLPRGDRAALRRRDLGFVFQDFNLLPGLTALENVALPLELDGRPLGAARDEARTALAGVEMGPMADRFPDTLSGGEQQRVAIARAFVGVRSVLLADEPTGALDSVTGELVMRLLRRHCDEGRTVLLATHNAAHAAWADRVLFLRDGLLVDAAQAPVPPPQSPPNGYLRVEPGA